MKEQSISDVNKKLQKGFAVSEGPFVNGVETALQSLNVQRQQYHGGAFFGNHVNKMLQVCVSKKCSPLCFTCTKYKLQNRLNTRIHCAHIDYWTISWFAPTWTDPVSTPAKVLTTTGWGGNFSLWKIQKSLFTIFWSVPQTCTIRTVYLKKKWQHLVRNFNSDLHWPPESILIAGDAVKDFFGLFGHHISRNKEDGENAHLRNAHQWVDGSMQRWIWVNVEQSTEAIHAHFNKLYRTYGSIANKVE